MTDTPTTKHTSIYINNLAFTTEYPMYSVLSYSVNFFDAKLCKENFIYIINYIYNLFYTILVVSFIFTDY